MKPNRRPLAAMTAAVFALSAPLAYSNTFFVTNCNDSGAGSLRSAVTFANTTDIVDMSGLKTSDAGCSASTITLTTGDIVVLQDDLTIAGPGADKLTVTGQYMPASGTLSTEHHRIFTHAGKGKLVLQNFSIAHGYLYTSGKTLGGCIFSSGSVEISDSNISYCFAISTGGSVYGGALYTKGKSALDHVNLSRNVALALSSGIAFGGAIFDYGGLDMRYSTVTSNSAACPVDATNDSSGGGVYSIGSDTYILSSTISRNTACGRFGGLNAASSSVTIVNTTIANNQAINDWAGGALIQSQDASIFNSTIAFNRGASNSFGISPGLALQSTHVTLDSNVISNNVYGPYDGNPNDISSLSGVTITGAKNLIFAPNASVPSDTIVGHCPLLGTLRNNGGPTDTLALQSRSPAINAGANEFATLPSYDQRGTPFIRTSGVASDIGAYELQQDEIIFTSNFEGCP